MNPDKPSKWEYEEHAKSLPSDDFWGQIRRTVFGKPVPEEQIQKIVDSIIEGLELRSGNVLLDIGCGNAALAARLFSHCSECFGIDSSEYLISVANTHFAGPRHVFVCQDAVEYATQERNPLRFDKALCYGMFAYLPTASAKQLLAILNRRFSNLRTIFIGALPDRDRVTEFYTTGLEGVDLDDPGSQIGVWRTRDEIADLAGSAGWSVRIQQMAPDFYQSHYRYNAILEHPG